MKQDRAAATIFCGPSNEMPEAGTQGCRRSALFFAEADRAGIRFRFNPSVRPIPSATRLRHDGTAAFCRSSAQPCPAQSLTSSCRLTARTGSLSQLQGGDIGGDGSLDAVGTFAGTDRKRHGGARGGLRIRLPDCGDRLGSVGRHFAERELAETQFRQCLAERVPFDTRFELKLNGLAERFSRPFHRLGLSHDVDSRTTKRSTPDRLCGTTPGA